MPSLSCLLLSPTHLHVILSCVSLSPIIHARGFMTLPVMSLLPVFPFALLCMTELTFFNVPLRKPFCEAFAASLGRADGRCFSPITFSLRCYWVLTMVHSGSLAVDFTISPRRILPKNSDDASLAHISAYLMTLVD